MHSLESFNGGTCFKSAPILQTGMHAGYRIQIGGIIDAGGADNKTEFLAIAKMPAVEDRLKILIDLGIDNGRFRMCLSEDRETKVHRRHRKPYIVRPNLLQLVGKKKTGVSVIPKAHAIHGIGKVNGADHIAITYPPLSCKPNCICQKIIRLLKMSLMDQCTRLIIQDRTDKCGIFPCIAPVQCFLAFDLCLLQFSLLYVQEIRPVMFSRTVRSECPCSAETVPASGFSR